MRMRPVLAATLLSLACGVGTLSGTGQSRNADLSFSCATFPPTLTEADLKARFSEPVVTRDLVPWGGAEGDHNEGTVLFTSRTDARLEIYWKDRQTWRAPDWVSVRGEKGQWRTPDGIALGTDLRTLERLNRRPFRLLSYGSDGGGTVLSWSGGRLEALDSTGCRIRIRVRPVRPHAHGDLPTAREVSSGHPAMQAMNPSVYELFIQYSR